MRVSRCKRDIRFEVIETIQPPYPDTSPQAGGKKHNTGPAVAIHLADKNERTAQGMTDPAQILAQRPAGAPQPAKTTHADLPRGQVLPGERRAS